MIFILITRFLLAERKPAPPPTPTLYDVEFSTTLEDGTIEPGTAFTVTDANGGASPLMSGPDGKITFQFPAGDYTISGSDGNGFGANGAFSIPEGTTAIVEVQVVFGHSVSEN